MPVSLHRVRSLNDLPAHAVVWGRHKSDTRVEGADLVVAPLRKGGPDAR
jgi:hypothetical protein